MSQDAFYLLTPPENLREVRSYQALPAHLAYRLSPDLQLLRTPAPQPLRGGIMVICDAPQTPSGSPHRLCQQIDRECAAHGYRGILLDTAQRLPELENLISQLAQQCAARGRTLFLPEHCASLSQRSKILISSALSGGVLSARLAQAVENFGSRVVLAVERSAEDFTLPALTGGGKPLTSEELNALCAQLHPNVFFSRELCARYFTYRGGDGSVHFVLFDDEETLQRKMETARSCGISAFLLPWAEIRHAPESFGLTRTNVSSQHTRNVPRRSTPLASESLGRQGNPPFQNS